MPFHLDFMYSLYIPFGPAQDLMLCETAIFNEQLLAASASGEKFRADLGPGF